MKKIKEEIERIFESETSFGILCGVGVVVVSLLIFSAGVSVGFHRASFGRAWGENYERNFGMMPDRPIFGGDNFPNAHGVIGKILKIQLPNIIVQGKDNTEKVVLTNNDTEIQKARIKIKNTDLKIDDFVVVIGSPDAQGQIEAKFIRVMPFGMPLPPSQPNS